MTETRLQRAIRQKFGTPQRALAVLGLPASLLHATGRPARALARDEAEEPDFGRELESGSSNYSERLQLLLKFLRGRLSDKDFVKAEGILRGDESVTDAERERQSEAATAMDSARASNRVRRLTDRIKVY
jgi:hypothetical protein